MNEYRMMDTIFESGPLKLNIAVNLIQYLPETDMFEERVTHYWNEYKVESRPQKANVLIKRKIDYFLSLELKDYDRNNNDSIFIPNDLMVRFADSIDYAYELSFGRNQTMFIKENGILRITNLLPLVSDTYPKNKIFKIIPTIINTRDYQRAGATLVVGNSECMCDITDTQFGYLTRILRNFNGPMYASTMLAALPRPNGAYYNQGTPQERRPDNRVPRGRTFAGREKGII